MSDFVTDDERMKEGEACFRFQARRLMISLTKWMSIGEGKQFAREKMRDEQVKGKGKLRSISCFEWNAPSKSRDSI